MAFVDLEKASDHVPHNVTWRAMCKVGTEEWIVQLEQGMYANAKSHVCVGNGFSNEFKVKEGLVCIRALS